MAAKKKTKLNLKLCEKSNDSSLSNSNNRNKRKIRE